MTEKEKRAADKAQAKADKKHQHAIAFDNWLKSLKPHELLDLAMNCLWLMGRDIKPEEDKNDGK